MGARQRLSEDFINALSDDFAKHGVSVVQQVREEKPVAYLELVAALMPKNVNVEHSGASAFAALWDAIAEGKSGGAPVQSLSTEEDACARRSRLCAREFAFEPADVKRAAPLRARLDESLQSTSSRGITVAVCDRRSGIVPFWGSVRPIQTASRSSRWQDTFPRIHVVASPFGAIRSFGRQGRDDRLADPVVRADAQGCQGRSDRHLARSAQRTTIGQSFASGRCVCPANFVSRFR